MITMLLASALACPPSPLPYLSIEQGTTCLAFPQDQNPQGTGGTDFGYYYGQYGETPDPKSHWITRMALEIENTCADAVTLREPGCTDCLFDVDIAPGATVVIDVPEPPEQTEVDYVLEVTEGTAIIDITVTAVGGETIPCGTGDTGGTEPEDTGPTTDTDTGATQDTSDTAATDDTGNGTSESSGCGCTATTQRAGWWPLALFQRRSIR